MRNALAARTGGSRAGWALASVTVAALLTISCDVDTTIEVVNRLGDPVVILIDGEPLGPNANLAPGERLDIGVNSSDLPLLFRAVDSSGAIVFERTLSPDDIDAGEIRVVIAGE